MNLNFILNKIYIKKNLTIEESNFIFNKIMNGELNDIEITAILISLKIKNESISEIITWYNYLLSKGYKKINFIGHSRGALNIAQSLAIIENQHKIN